MLIDCKNCGAPLDVPERGWFTTCGYCRTTQRVAKPPQGIYNTPPDWRAPQTWTPPPRVPANTAQPLQFNPYAAKKKTRSLVGLVIFLVAGAPLVVIFGVVIVAVAAVGTSNRTRSDSSAQTTPVEDWDGKKTFVCSGFDKPVLEDLDLEVTADPPFRFEGHCKLRIVDAKLRLKHWFEPGNQFNQITLVDSELTVEELADDAPRLGRLKLEDSKLSLPSRNPWRVDETFEAEGGEITFRHQNGFSGSSLADVTLDGTTIVVEGAPGKPTLLFASFGHTSLEVTDGKIYLKAGDEHGELTLGSCHGLGDVELTNTDVFIAPDPAPGRFTLFDLNSINASGKMKKGSIDAGKKPIFTKGRNAKVDTDLKGSSLQQRR